jgi:exodeoxyribonuclease VII small subunit
MTLEAGMSDNFNFEKALEDLNAIVTKMEEGKLSLEESLAYFEKGVSLTRDCQQALQKAEQKVQILTGNSGDFALNDYQPEE